jgi:hypothetical protein
MLCSSKSSDTSDSTGCELRGHGTCGTRSLTQASFSWLAMLHESLCLGTTGAARRETYGPHTAPAGRHSLGGGWDEVGPDRYVTSARAKAPQREAVAFKTELNDVREEPHGGECQGQEDSGTA